MASRPARPRNVLTFQVTERDVRHFGRGRGLLPRRWRAQPLRGVESQRSRTSCARCSTTCDLLSRQPTRHERAVPPGLAAIPCDEVDVRSGRAYDGDEREGPPVAASTILRAAVDDGRTDGAAFSVGRAGRASPQVVGVVATSTAGARPPRRRWSSCRSAAWTSCCERRAFTRPTSWCEDVEPRPSRGGQAAVAGLDSACRSRHPRWRSSPPAPSTRSA